MWAGGSQFSTGDQGGSKIKFWEGGMRSCPSCSGSSISQSTHCAGVRHNGDGYGTEVYSCKDCSWKTSFQYDDACKIIFYHLSLLGLILTLLLIFIPIAETYFYETKYWGEEHKPKPVVPYRDMDKELTQKYTKVMKLVGEYAVRQNMKEDGVFPEAIDKFITDLGDKSTLTKPSLVTATLHENKKEKEKDKEIEYKPLTAEDRVRFTEAVKQARFDAVRPQMQQAGYSERAIDEFFTEICISGSGCEL